MKTHIWNYTETFPGKVNFIDDNNVLVGYSLQQDCCEDAFWTIGESEDGKGTILHRGDNTEPKEFELSNYVFDSTFHNLEEDGCEAYVAIFKLISYHKSHPDLYLRLENHHNGYYSHGFVFRGDIVVEGTL